MNFFTDVITYPLRGSGKYVLLIGAIISIAADLSSLAPMIGAIAGFFVFCYFCAVYFNIIQSSAVGGKEAPEYPDLSNIMEDVIWPMLQITMILVASLSPFLIYHFATGEAANPLVSLTLVGVAITYAPMAILSVSVLGYMGAISPHIIIPSIFRAGWLYVAAVLLVLGIYWLQSKAADFLSGLFIVKFVILSLIGMYCMMANGRALGLIFRQKREELNWI